ncbi:MAG: hypothetical protein JWO08_3057 [Verrucomicrobiaceae bacterium]|nr:hypothetical protein [Verrucomicrobiaceae bacterium]
MTLNFTFTEYDALAFHERFYRDSKSYQAIRNRVRWSVPCIFVAMAFCFPREVDFPLVRPVLFFVFAVLWWFLYPRRFDARVRSLARKQMQESSYAKTFGACELQLLDEHLYSMSPLGTSTYAWASVDRVVMDADYLFIFLVGARGYSIRISEIGQEAAQRAHDFIAARIRPCLPPPLP